MRQFPARITHNEPVAEKYFELAFEWPDDLGRPLPGQFLNIRCSDKSVPLLRRPFAFSRFLGASPRTNSNATTDDTIAKARPPIGSLHSLASFIYEVRGGGTEALSGKHVGDALDIIGPLGNSFPMPENGRIPILVSGGIGFGPVYFLAQTFALAGIEYRFIHGVRAASFIPGPMIDMNNDDRERAIICSDDGSAGFAGTTVDFMHTLPDELISRAVIYACGPHPMLKACHTFAAGHNIACYVSVEAIMGCGFGACMGCVVRKADDSGFARVCIDGPVFESRKLSWT